MSLNSHLGCRKLSPCVQWRIRFGAGVVVEKTFNLSADERVGSLAVSRTLALGVLEAVRDGVLIQLLVSLLGAQTYH